MDDKIKIIEKDLPTPPSVIFSEEERKERRLKLLVVLFVFLSIYSFLHKILIPLALSFTPLKESPYSKLDPSFLLPAVLSILLLFKPNKLRWISFLVGAAITYGACEVLEVSKGNYIGWLSFSRLLSSVPIALLSLFLITANYLPRSAKIAWVGAFSLILLYYAHWLFPNLNSVDVSRTKINPTVRTLPTSEQMGCGLSELRILADTPLANTESNIVIEKCGFSPALVRLSQQKILLKNKLDKPVNVHMIYSKEDKTVIGWNVLIPAKQELSREVVLQPGAVAMLYSDSMPEAGVTGLISSPLASGWLFSRNPIRLQAISEF